MNQPIDSKKIQKEEILEQVRKHCAPEEYENYIDHWEHNPAAYISQLVLGCLEKNPDLANDAKFLEQLMEAAGIKKQDHPLIALDDLYNTDTSMSEKDARNNVNPLVTNAEVRHDPRSYGFAVYRKSENEQRELVLTLDDNDPALFFPNQIPSGHRALLKGDFKSWFNGDASESVVGAFLEAYGPDGKENARTVGCGSNVILMCEDGIFQTVVQRSAPGPKTPSGVVNPGTYSRAAGGGAGDIEESQIRELMEELNIFIKTKDGKYTPVNLVRDDITVGVHISAGSYLSNLSAKHASLAEVFASVASGQVLDTTMSMLNVPAFPVYMPGVTETVTQIIGGKSKQIRAVVTEDAKNGDVNGVDAVLVVQMPKGVRSCDLIIADGERNLQGELMNRRWSLHDPIALMHELDKGQKKFSQTPEKVVRNAPALMGAIRTLVL